MAIITTNPGGNLTTRGIAMRKKLTIPSDQGFLTAWQAQLQVALDPHLNQQLLHREYKLLPQFAKQYQKLSTLPRRMGRGLQ